jgi:hypothetical protein
MAYNSTGSITVRRGETVSLSLTFSSWVIADAWLQVRTTASATTTLLALAVGTGLTLTATGVDVAITAGQTEALTVGSHEYDLLVELDSGAREFALPTAPFTVARAVTEAV